MINLLLYSSDIASLLVENKANINDSGGDHCHQTTPLMDAAINGYADIVQYLINEGAELMRTNDKVLIYSSCNDHVIHVLYIVVIM